jgi:hypothetical protein
MLPIQGLVALAVVVYLSAVPQKKIHHTMRHTRYLTKRIDIAGLGTSLDRGAL